MAKRVKQGQAEPDGPELGNPGEFYFAEPQVVEVKAAKPHQVETYNNNSVTYGQGTCRLKSSHAQSDYKPPENLEYHLSRWPGKMDVDAYLEIMRVQGFSKGAIVCRKYQKFDQHSMIHRWGMILLEHTWQVGSEYRPYCIKWIGDGTVESAWAEDLYLIHQAVDERLLYDILESQGCDIPEKVI